MSGSDEFLKFNKFNQSSSSSGVIFPKPPTHLVPSYSSLPCSRADSTNSGCSGLFLHIFTVIAFSFLK